MTTGGQIPRPIGDPGREKITHFVMGSDGKTADGPAVEDNIVETLAVSLDENRNKAEHLDTPQFSHSVVVAIDFGTTYSGYAYSFTHDPENTHIMRKWEGNFT